MKKLFKNSWLIFASCLALTACSSGKKSNDNNSTKEAKTATAPASTARKMRPKAHFETGKVIERIACQNDTSLHYALYLPSNYTTAKKWPIIYFFDAHGAGDLPLKNYHKLAEAYHFILVGFYNSKNGMDFNKINDNAQKLLDDTYQSLSIDSTRIYTGGFSGGAKVAGLIAGYDGGITGVIACSAGLPQINKPLQYKFNYIAIAGLKDFNYTGLKKQDQGLEQVHFRHQLLTFGGIHEWPPKATMQEAFDWLEVNAMLNHLIPKNDSLIKAIKGRFEKEIAAYNRKNDQYNVYLTYKKMFNYLQGLTNLKPYEKIMGGLATSDMIKKAKAEKAAVAQQEIQLQRHYIQAMSKQNIAWWQNEVKHLHALIKQNEGTDKGYMYERTLNFLSLAAYMQAIAAVRQNATTDAVHFNTIYALVDPTNPEHSYLSACLDARANKKTQTFSELHEAAKLGFDDYTRFKADTNFTALKSDKEYGQIVEAMKKNVK